MSVIHAKRSVKGRVTSLSIHRLGLYLFLPLSTTLRFSLLNCSLDGRSMGMSGSKPDRLPCGACALPVACWMRGSSPVSSYSTYRDDDVSHTHTHALSHLASSMSHHLPALPRAVRHPACWLPSSCVHPAPPLPLPSWRSSRTHHPRPQPVTRPRSHCTHPRNAHQHLPIPRSYTAHLL